MVERSPGDLIGMIISYQLRPQSTRVLRFLPCSRLCGPTTSISGSSLFGSKKVCRHTAVNVIVYKIQN